MLNEADGTRRYPAVTRLWNKRLRTKSATFQAGLKNIQATVVRYVPSLAGSFFASFAGVTNAVLWVSQVCLSFYEVRQRAGLFSREDRVSWEEWCGPTLCFPGLQCKALSLLLCFYLEAHCGESISAFIAVCDAFLCPHMSATSIKCS